MVIGQKGGIRRLHGGFAESRGLCAVMELQDKALEHVPAQQGILVEISELSFTPYISILDPLHLLRKFREKDYKGFGLISRMKDSATRLLKYICNFKSLWPVKKRKAL